MVLALAFHWRRLAIASASLLGLGACETMTTPGAPEQPAAEVVDRSPRVASEIARGRQALAAGDLSAAQSAFTGALRGSPNDPEPAIGLAETYLAMGDVETAGRLFDIVASTEGGAGDARLLQGRGLVALGQGQTDQAIGFLEQSVERDPTQWRAWAGLGRAYGRKGNTRQARTAFNRAEESAPSPAVVMNDVGMLHLEEDDPSAALEAFQRALSVDPGNTVASANARIARAMLGEYDAAVSGARPDELPHVLNNVGYIAVVNGDFDVADRLLRRAIDISPVYHESASANLELLAQAMRGEPVGTLADRGAAGSRMAAGAEPSFSVAAPADGPAGATAWSGDAGGVAADGTSTVLSGDVPRPALAQPAAPVAPAAAAPVGLASVPPRLAAAEAGGGVMAHGFRWEEQPQSAAPKKRRRKAARSQSHEVDPRSAGWPAISIPSSAAEAGSDDPRPGQEPLENPPRAVSGDGGEPAAVEQDPAANPPRAVADDRSEPAAVEQDAAAEDEVAVSPVPASGAAGSPE
jgi:Flp pilus assembly protein TadD